MSEGLFDTSPSKDIVGKSTCLIPSHLSPMKLTEVFDSYWRFAAARQSVYFNRLGNTAPPWTTDPIISTHKFTNAYRASDRVSQYLIRQVIYRNDLPSAPQEVLFRLCYSSFSTKLRLGSF